MVWENVEHTFVEIDPFCQQVIKKHWPNSPIHGDIKDFATNSYFDLITGGFPCQPFSSAGKKRGIQDERWLWPEMFRVIREVRPPWVIAENVRGLVTTALDQILDDLESVGYSTRTFGIPASSVGTWHKRERIWIVAHLNNHGLHGAQNTKSNSTRGTNNKKRQEQLRQPKRSNPLRFETSIWQKDWAPIAAKFCRANDGIPNRTHRIKALGNAIVPHVAAQIFKAICLIEKPHS